jgi:hypothetical protein
MNKYLSRGLVFVKAHPLLISGIVGFILGFGVTKAFADNGVLTWTAPTTCANGTPTTNCPTTGYRIEHRLSATGTWATVTTTGPTALTYTHVNLPVGDNYWRLFTVAASGESVPTNPVTKVVTAPLPSPPGGFTVNVMIAYNVVKQRDKFVLVAVGIVPPGTRRDPMNNVNGHCAVPRDSVAWYGSVRPEVVVVECG